MKAKSYYFTIIAGGMVGFLVSACAPIEISDEDQSASLASYGDHTFQGTKPEHFFSARTAMLFSADQLQLTESNSRNEKLDSGAISASISVEFSKAETALKNFATAAAIDSRGYFLTAAHCVDEGDTYAFFGGKNYEFEAKKIRIVKMGEPLANDFDFAIFHVDSPPLRIYRWSDTYSIEDTVFSVGASIRDDGEEEAGSQMVLDPFAGKIESRDALASQGIPYEKIGHRSPIRSGNSGGPLVGTNGKLIGINYAGKFRSKWNRKQEVPLAFAVRPEWKWIKEIIEKDWAELQRKKST